MTQVAISAFKTTWDDTQLNTFRAISANPVHGAKTITTTAASLFAGASAVVNRIGLEVNNTSANYIYFGGSGVTAATGIPMAPGDTRYFSIRKGSTAAVYFIAESDSAVRVMEYA